MKKALLIAALLCSPAFGAISANSVFEIRSDATASNVNGCAFVTGATGMDFSLQAAPQATTTAATVVNATTTIVDVALVDYTVTANDVGNFLHETGGSATDGWYEITVANTGTNQWTLDRAIGTAGQTVVGRMGGACVALTSALLAVPVTGNKVYIKDLATPYAVAAAISGVGAADYLQIEGYTTTRGDCDKPTLQATAGSFTMLTMSNASAEGMVVRCLIFDGNGQTAIAGVAGGSGYKKWQHLEFDDFAAATVTLQQATGEDIVVTGQRAGSPFTFAGNNNKCQWCRGLDPTSTTSHTFTWSANSFGTCEACIGEGHASATNIDVFNIGAQGGAIYNSVAYNAGRYGFHFLCGANCADFTVYNSIADTAVTACFAMTGSPSTVYINNNYNGVFCTTNYSGMSAGANDVDLSVSPFTAAGTTYTLNSTAGGGAALKGVGYFGNSGVGSGFMDIGALQSEASGGVRVFGGQQ